jgi:hypothetical protein
MAPQGKEGSVVVPPMNSGIGGPAGYGENRLLHLTKSCWHDDDGSIEIDVTSVFGQEGIDFFGASYDSLFLIQWLEHLRRTSDILYPAGIAKPEITLFWTNIPDDQAPKTVADLCRVHSQKN